MATQTMTFTGDFLLPGIDDDNESAQLAVRLKASTVYPKGCVLGEVAASPGTFAPYDDTAVDGTAVARMLLTRACETDASGLISYSTTQSTGEEWGQKHYTAQAYHRGTFKTIDLPQSGTGALDAAAIADFGRLISGTLADGLLQIG